MLIILGWLLVCLLPTPTFQQECGNCFCPSSKPVPKSELSIDSTEEEITDPFLGNEEGFVGRSLVGRVANRKLDLDAGKIKEKYQELKKIVKGKMEGLGLKLQQENALITILENAENLLENKISTSNRFLPTPWSAVYNVLVPVRKKIMNRVFGLQDGCNFQNAIKCSMTLGDVVLGCTITTDNLARILECSHVDAAKEQCGQCVCQIVSFFQNKTKAKIIGQLPICKA